jgi:hypothetical protein
MLMWGRLATCGRLSIGLPTTLFKPARRVTNPLQVDNLPHISILRALLSAWRKACYLRTGAA